MSKRIKLPVHRKLIDDIKKKIVDNKFKKGELLPSENELARVYNTSRTTVRLALIELSNMGYISRHQGKGSIVAEARRALGILSVSGITDEVGHQKLKTVILQKPVTQPWPSSIFYKLSDTELSVGCIFFKRLRYIDNEPVLFEETYITNLNLPHFTNRNLENRSLLKLLHEQYNVEVIGGEQKIWAVPIGKANNKLLKLKPGSPIVHMKRKIKTNVKDLNIYSWLYCNTEKYYIDDFF